MRKLICMALVLVIVMGILSGCCCSSFMYDYTCDWCGEHQVSFSHYTHNITTNGIRRSYELCEDCYNLSVSNSHF